MESSIGRAPLQEDSYGENSAKIYSTYEPSSQVKYSPDKYLIAEKIQSAIRQQPAYAQVCNQIIQLLFIYIYFQTMRNSFFLHRSNNLLKISSS